MKILGITQHGTEKGLIVEMAETELAQIVGMANMEELKKIKRAPETGLSFYVSDMYERAKAVLDTWDAAKGATETLKRVSTRFLNILNGREPPSEKEARKKK